jgi:hypothetical protein
MLARRFEKREPEKNRNRRKPELRFQINLFSTSARYAGSCHREICNGVSQHREKAMSMSANQSAFKKAERDVQEALSKIALAINADLGGDEIKRRGNQFSQAAKIYSGVVEACK